MLYVAWIYRDGKWACKPLGHHPDVEAAREEAQGNYPGVCQVEPATYRDPAILHELSHG